MRKMRGGWGETVFSPPPPPFPSRARLIFALLVRTILSESLEQARTLGTGHYVSPWGSEAEDFAGGITRFLEEQKRGGGQ